MRRLTAARSAGPRSRPESRRQSRFRPRPGRRTYRMPARCTERQSSCDCRNRPNRRAPWRGLSGVPGYRRRRTSGSRLRHYPSIRRPRTVLPCSDTAPRLAEAPLWQHPSQLRRLRSRPPACAQTHPRRPSPRPADPPRCFVPPSATTAAGRHAQGARDRSLQRPLRRYPWRHRQRHSRSRTVRAEGTAHRIRAPRPASAPECSPPSPRYRRNAGRTPLRFGRNQDRNPSLKHPTRRADDAGTSASQGTPPKDPHRLPRRPALSGLIRATPLQRTPSRSSTRLGRARQAARLPCAGRTLWPTSPAWSRALRAPLMQSTMTRRRPPPPQRSARRQPSPNLAEGPLPAIRIARSSRRGYTAASFLRALPERART